MKVIKETYCGIEDYSVGDTTLEQVFLSFAKKQEVLDINEWMYYSYY